MILLNYLLFKIKINKCVNEFNPFSKENKIIIWDMTFHLMIDIYNLIVSRTKLF